MAGWWRSVSWDRLPRNHDVALDVAELGAGLGAEGGHAELVYDFREGGGADGWLHCLARYENRQSGHTAETSFGAHIFNTLMTYKGEPQSYNGPPPGLTTRLFLKLGDASPKVIRSSDLPGLCREWHPHSGTMLMLHDSDGVLLAEQAACRLHVPARRWFGRTRCSARRCYARAGAGGYVMVDDRTCRLFGYHGLMDDAGRVLVGPHVRVLSG